MARPIDLSRTASSGVIAGVRLDSLGPRIDGRRAVPLGDLLLSKLQIWEINRKDFGDAACLP